MKRIIVILMLLGTAFALTFGMFFMSGCSNSKQVQKTKYIYTERIDSVIVNGKTEYITKIDSVKVDCPDQPKTRFEVRNERKSKEDSLKYALKMLKEKNAFTIDSLNKVIKLSRIQKNVHKIDAKQVIKATKAINQKAFKWYHWVFITIGSIILLFIGFLIGKYLSKLL